MLIQNFINNIKEKDKNFKPKVILDIGSRDLEQSIEFNLIYPDAKIYAFEPNPEQYQICYNKSLKYENISVFKQALSTEIGETSFFVTHGNVGASSLLKPIDVPFGFNRDITEIKIETTTLEFWKKENNIDSIDILWMDVQGVELNILKSMDKNTIENIKFIHCEASEKPYYEGHQLKKELEEFLEQNNFEVYFHMPAYHPYNEGDIIAINKNLK